MRDNYCTTFITKNGGYSFVSGRQHFLGEEGDFGRAAIRRGCGIAKEMALGIQTGSPVKRDIIAVQILVRSEG